MRVSYSIDDAKIRATISSLSYATSDDGAVTFVSPHDDNAVRLASKGRNSTRTLDEGDETLLLQELGSQHGWLDKTRIDLDSSAVASRTLAVNGPADPDHSLASNDVISLPGKPVPAEQLAREEGEPLDAESATASPTSQPMDLIQLCGTVNPVPARTGKICMYYRPDFIDSFVTSSSVVSEDFDPYNSEASYANGRVYASNGTSDIWSGRLDADGCTPVVTYCGNTIRAELQLNSIRIPNTGSAPIIYGTRNIQITPPVFYTATTYLGSDAITGAPLAWAYVSSTSEPKQIRVASIVSEILRKSDNGVLRNKYRDPAPTLTIKLDNGCVGYAELMYAPGQYGGACASANEAEFGPEVDPSTLPPTLVNTHTTHSSYVVAHELGHSAQHSNNGANKAAVGSYDPPLFGMCSCDHVNIGNRLHCLQSKDHITLIHREGFAHHYATRIFNEKGADARFTYYKNFRNVTWTGPSSYSTWSSPPPRAVSAGQPFLGFPSNVNGPFRGWAKSFCGGFANENTEYDYLRFFWAINGSASSAEQSSLTDVFGIFGQDPTIPLTWTSIGTKAANVHGPTSAKYLRVYNSLFAHGLDQ